MAQYERKILVPYLKDVCCVEMLYLKVQQKSAEYNSAIRRYSNEINYYSQFSEPIKPQKENYSFDINKVIICICIYIGVSVVCAAFNISSILAIILVSIFQQGVIVGFIYYIYKGFKLKKEYLSAVSRYSIAEAEYEKARNNISKFQNQRKYAEKELEFWEVQEKEVSTLRQNVYSANIIARRYRNIHVAYYLYDYFSTCQEDDLDKVLQTMLLDEIVQRLDKIIRQNAEMILLQRRQVALQETMNEQLTNNHRQQMNVLTGMAENQKLQTEYLQMIDAGVRVSNYFALANYIEKNF